MMPELHFPWLQAAILITGLGAIAVQWMRSRQAKRALALTLCSIAFAFSVGEWVDFATVDSFEAHDHWDIVHLLFHSEVFVVDELSAPLLPLAALIYLGTVLSTLRTKVQRFSFSLTLASESIMLATLSCRASWTLVGLLIAATIPPWIELHRRQRCTRFYSLHLGTFVAFLIAGWGLLEANGRSAPSTLAILLLTGAALLRSGIFPLHCWLTDLFDKATFGTAILFVTPMTGAYAVMRLVFPFTPEWILQVVAWLSLFTAIYSAGMALVQSEARRYFCFLFLSHSSLVLIGLELGTPIALTGALSVWLSVGLSLTGFGLTLRGIEARIGRISLSESHGMFNQTPELAGFFLLTALASIGFPATVGFVGMELLVEGAINVFPLAGVLIVVAAALNGIAVLRAYFRVFAGSKHANCSSLRSLLPERLAVLSLALLILGGGLFPQPGIASRHRAAIDLIEARDHLHEIENRSATSE
jgi:NADH-quinone oxidoreductase subunit M